MIQAKRLHAISNVHRAPVMPAHTGGSPSSQTPWWPRPCAGPSASPRPGCTRGVWAEQMLLKPCSTRTTARVAAPECTAWDVTQTVQHENYSACGGTRVHRVEYCGVAMLNPVNPTWQHFVIQFRTSGTDVAQHVAQHVAHEC